MGLRQSLRRWIRQYDSVGRRVAELLNKKVHPLLGINVILVYDVEAAKLWVAEAGIWGSARRSSLEMKAEFLRSSEGRDQDC